MTALQLELPQKPLHNHHFLGNDLSKQTFHIQSQLLTSAEAGMSDMTQVKSSLVSIATISRETGALRPVWSRITSRGNRDI